MTKPNLLQKKNEMEVFSSKNMIKKIEDRKMAVIYKLELEDNNIFAVVVFENTHDYYTDNIIIDSDACDFWLYTGECYFYSPELTILFNEKLEENSSFKDFAKKYSGIEHVFTRYINPESGLIIWTTKILTEKGVQHWHAGKYRRRLRH